MRPSFDQRTDDGVWRPPPNPVCISPDEVHIWRASLILRPRLLAQLARTLSREERMRARRFRFSVHRDRFIAGRGLQRSILARYVGVPPAALAFCTTDYGKPELAGGQADSGIRFNVSNSGTLALYAIAMQREVGVDLEAVRPLPDVLALARLVCSSHERAMLINAPPAERELAFLRYWTQKEAYGKAMGRGLTASLDKYDFAHHADRRGRWLVKPLNIGQEFVGALVAEGTDWRLRLFQAVASTQALPDKA